MLFDLRHYPESVVVGIGKQSARYQLATKHESISKLPAYKRKPANISAESAPARYSVCVCVCVFVCVCMCFVCARDTWGLCVCRVVVCVVFCVVAERR